MSIPTIRMKTRLPPSTRAPPTAARGWRYRLLASTGASGSDASGVIASSGGSTSATRALLGRVILTTFHRAVPRRDLAWCPGGCRCAHVVGRSPVPHRALRCDRGRSGVRRRGHGRGGVRREDLHLVPLRLDGRYRPVLVGEERNEEDGSEDDDRPVGREEPPSSPLERLWWGDDVVITPPETLQRRRRWFFPTYGAIVVLAAVFLVAFLTYQDGTITTVQPQGNQVEIFTPYTPTTVPSSADAAPPTVAP